jgi:predicted DNA-binding protein (MmcQ/YjbR family)
VANARTTRRAVLRFALRLPEAYEDHPWGESVAKVNKKVFVFLGGGGDPEHLGMSVKLGDSREQALGIPGAYPTQYGLGRGGWVTIPFREASPPLEVLTDWVEESYRLVAPKSLVTKLDALAGRGR